MRGKFWKLIIDVKEPEADKTTLKLILNAEFESVIMFAIDEN